VINNKKMINNLLEKLGLRIITLSEWSDCNNYYLTMNKQDNIIKSLNIEIKELSEQIKQLKKDNKKLVDLTTPVTDPNDYINQYKLTNIGYQGRVVSDWLIDEEVPEIIEK
jgi:hypothetical protein